MNEGEVAILNCTDGDTKISFDPSSPEEVEHARTVVQDMLKRGYCLAVESEGKLHRVTKFDAKHSEYIVKPKKGRGPQKRLSARTHKAVAVARTAGGGRGCFHFIERHLHV